MKPKLPADINTLSAEELDALSTAIQTWATATLRDADASAEDKAYARELAEKRPEIKALAAQKRADAALADELDSDPDEALGDEDADAGEGEDAGDGEDADAGDADADADSTDEEAAQVPVLAGASNAKGRKSGGAQPKVPGGFGASGGGGSPKPAGERLAPQYLQATRLASGKEVGEAFESWAELAQACLDRAPSVAAGSTDKHTLAGIKATYPESRRLSDDMFVNLTKFENSAELTAAFCAPATPYYNLACMNTVRRPVFNSLPGFQAPRMRVTIMSSPSLSDIDSGFGQWEDTDDDDAAARKTPITIECGSPTTYKMYGVWRAMTVKNLMAMSYPELVEAWLNRLHAAHSRLAETLLLDAMGSGATEITAPRLGYGASVSITSTILNYLTLYRETQRWDIAGNMEAWTHRFVLDGMKIDIMRRRRTDGGFGVPSDGEIERMFREVGVNIHWFIDTPTWGNPIPAVGASTLNLLPQTVDILIAPPGKFALMDRGELSIGVTGDHLYRDNSSNEQNQFTLFWENFEGVVNTTSCPAHILSIPVCWNGVQADDVVMNCQGGDEAGYQS